MTVDKVIYCRGSLLQHAAMLRCMTVNILIYFPGCLLGGAASMHCVTVLSVIVGGVVTPCSQGSMCLSRFRA